jgi:hypothetical protein
VYLPSPITLLLFLFLLERSCFVVSVSAGCFCLYFMFVYVHPVLVWRFCLLEQFLFYNFCYVSVLFLLVSVFADGLLGLVPTRAKFSVVINFGVYDGLASYRARADATRGVDLIIWCICLSG